MSMSMSNLPFYLPKKYNEQGALNDSHIYFEGLSVHHLRKCVLYLALLSNSVCPVCPLCPVCPVHDDHLNHMTISTMMTISVMNILTMMTILNMMTNSTLPQPYRSVGPKNITYEHFQKNS